MIDKINGNGTYEYPGSGQRKKTAVKAYENTPGTKEAMQRGSAKVRGKNYSAGSLDKAAQGVILDLSKTKKESKKDAGEQKKFSFTAVLRQLFEPLLMRLKAFWESDAKKGPDETSLSDETDQLPPLDTLDAMSELDAAKEAGGIDEAAGPVDYDTAAQQALQSGDLKQIEQLLTAGGTKRPARNSDLLTYYDRWGKIVEMDESERHRVLFGDKNVLKL